MEAAANVAELTDEGGDGGTVVREAGEGIEGGELGCRAEDGKLLGLAVDIEEPFREGLDLIETGGFAIEAVGGPAGEGDGAFDRGAAPGERKGRADRRPVSAVRDDVAARAGTKDEGDGVDDERFAGACFARENGEPGPEVDGDLAGDGEG
jgi:hypothetical protein